MLRPYKVAMVVLIWVELSLNPHPRKAEGAASKYRTTVDDGDN
jgi:hypothetical protein